jgi:hypothetical protein
MLFRCFRPEDEFELAPAPSRRTTSKLREPIRMAVIDKICAILIHLCTLCILLCSFWLET